MFTRLAPTKPPFVLRMAFALLHLYDPGVVKAWGVGQRGSTETVLEALEIMSSVTYFLALSATVLGLCNAAERQTVGSSSL